MADETYTAELVQFMRPRGDMQSVTTQLPIATEPRYQEMLAAGCRLECEELKTEEVSVTIKNDEEDVDIEVSPNGPDVQVGLVAMLERGLWNS